MPHVAFLHERFLFRFGHDRTMLLHGRELVRRGWRVSFVAFAADAEVIRAIGARPVLLKPDAPSYLDLDAWACPALREHWWRLFRDGAPDVVVNGGWPFYAFNADAEALGAAAVAFDAGATPLDGLPQADLPVHVKLRELRARHMGQARRTVAVSEFIAATQTRVDAPGVPCVVAPNGADHIVEPLWTSDGEDDAGVRAALEAARRDGRRAVLHLGRWEGGYKNRDGALEVLRQLRRTHDVALIVLAVDDPELPDDLRAHVVFAGHPGDAGLRTLMSEADAGFGASLWEGFNLPLAEMLYLGRPAFALDIGAHREVVSDPGFVRSDLADLAAALARALDGDGPTTTPQALAAYRDRLSWSRAAGRLEAVLWDAVQEKRGATPARLLALDVTNASRDTANSGVVRVTRQLARALQPLHRLLFLTWDEGLQAGAGGYRTLDGEERSKLASYGGPDLEGEAAPRPLEAALAARGATLAEVAWLCPETVLQPRAPDVAAFFARERIAPAAVLHDLIPHTHPEGCSPEIVAAFPAYADVLAGAGVLLANSETTAAAWRAFAGERDAPAVVVERLPGDFGPRRAPRPRLASGTSEDPVRVLTVSTFEPRKNHLGLLAAWPVAKAQARGRRLELHLVGGGYAGDGGVAGRVRAAAAADPSIVVHGLVDDGELDRLYAECDFTVYPSLWEGFGLPLAESLHHARPFVCSDRGSMAEIAEGGGGLTCDVADPQALGAAIARLATDDALRARLGRRAALTPVRTWRDYARACLGHALGARPPAPLPAPRAAAPRGARQLIPDGADMNWDRLLYPEKPVTAWQMSDSERMALTGLLARRRPKTYLEIGTFHGGSALLASEFSDWVITVDIDPAAETRFDKPDNVSFVLGRSQEVLPDLLQDLLARDLYPEFVLIDGDHSAEGVRADIEMFLRIAPPHPLVIVFHDSFNPVCRSGILSADWSACPHVARLDVDFVPGRLVEMPGDPFRGQMWGGLALAVLTPETHPVPYMTATSEELFRRTLAQATAHAA